MKIIMREGERKRKYKKKKGDGELGKTVGWMDRQRLKLHIQS